MMQIGLFGGTFNPVHTGHLRVALEVCESFNLDRLLLIPSAIPPHKEQGELVSAADRFEMLRIAIGGSRLFKVSDVELKRSGPSYTIDTIKHFRAEVPAAKALYLIVGMDAFFEIDTWKDYPALFELVSFIVLDRPGSWKNSARDQNQIMEAFLKSRVSKDYQRDPSQAQVCFRHPSNQSVYLTTVTQLDITSTHIRALRRANRAITYLMPAKVEEYILDRGLYQ